MLSSRLIDSFILMLLEQPQVDLMLLSILNPDIIPIHLFLQVTFQACNIDEARTLYDQLAVLAPIMVQIQRFYLFCSAFANPRPKFPGS